MHYRKKVNNTFVLQDREQLLDLALGVSVHTSLRRLDLLVELDERVLNHDFNGFCLIAIDFDTVDFGCDKH